MATLLDISLLGFLLPLFIFLLVFVILYAILSKTNLFGEKGVALNFIASFCVAAVSVFTGTFTSFVSVVTPWIVFIGFILVMIFAIFKFFSLEDNKIWDTIGGPTLIYVIILIVLLIGVAVVFGSDVAPSGEGGVKNEVIVALTHPRILGALFILLVSAFAVRLLSEKLE